jgi:hypothetical protein
MEYLRLCVVGPRHPLHISSVSRLKQRHRRSRQAGRPDTSLAIAATWRVTATSAAQA